MALNNKAQVMFYALMIGIVIVVLALALTKPVKEYVTEARWQVNCTNDAISDYDKASCVQLDLTLPFFIGGLIIIGITIIGARIIWG